MFCLNLDKSKRVLSATLSQFVLEDGILADYLPEGELSNYKYINGEYVFEPLPILPQIEAPTLEERTAATEAAIMAIMGGMQNV